MGPLEGRSALVTGGGRGIGRAIALALAAAGAHVVVTGRSLPVLEQARDAILKDGGAAEAFSCNIADSQAVRSLFETIRTRGRTVDILVNNAGITFSKKFHETPDDVFDGIMQTNVNGMFHCCKAALPGMIEKHWGRIVTISSIAGLGGLPFSSAYSASKHAQIGLTRSLALEVSRYNIAVNAICPGWTDTEMLDKAIANIVKTTGRKPEEARADLLRLSGQTRVVKPEEVAAEALRLASLEDANITGQAITIL